MVGNAPDVPETPDSINAFTVVGEFGFKRIPGPFTASKDGTVWVIDIPKSADHPSIPTLDSDEGKSAVVVADGVVCGGGIVTNIITDLENTEKRVLIDQYAMGDPYAGAENE